ncbi:hypothetical protein J6590_012800 [Homalodisca vitripennis]|nr:hypothetical protein J6590_012800 [Homalodisca vitripennis]
MGVFLLRQDDDMVWTQQLNRNRFGAQEKPCMGVFLLRQDDDMVWSSRTMRRWLVVTSGETIYGCVPAAARHGMEQSQEETEKPCMGVFLLRQDDDMVWSSRTMRRWLVVTSGNNHELYN